MVNFQKIAPTVYVELDYINYMESFKKNATMNGEISGKEEAAKEELATIGETVKNAKEEASATGKNTLIVLVANGGKVSEYGLSFGFGIIPDEFDEAIEVSQRGQGISFEYIVEQNPDYLFVIDRGASCRRTDLRTRNGKTNSKWNKVRIKLGVNRSYLNFLDQ
ncbi:MAG TPA: ABC transporter substrate-binding protein [Chondromyces sp.]|nr:ABC transporter substrate-binding protein [Chondromyces sp.]